jgi:SAM-dependent MidA family methyltransferase
MPTPVHQAVAERIRRHGPVGYDDVVEAALYDANGFFASGGRAGRIGDFLTSPEVGPLFGAVVARALDRWWTDLGRPDPFTVVEAGAGIGTLAVAIRAAEPECLGAMTYVLVERSAPLRDRQGEHLPVLDPALALPPSVGDEPVDGALPTAAATGPRFTSLSDLPAGPLVGVVVANELLDNLPFRVLECVEGGEGASVASWREVAVALDADDQMLVERLVPITDDALDIARRLAPAAIPGARIPLATAAAAWLRRAVEVLARGRVLVFDYGASTGELAARDDAGWLRTYRGHERGDGPLVGLGTQDVTADVPTDQLALVRCPVHDIDQATWLARHGLAELVEHGRQVWAERAHLGDLPALRARSRVREAEALTDPAGLGAFRVLEWEC